jgi:hypothetical protein
MKTNNLKSISEHLTDYFILYLSFIIIIITFLVSTQFPTYFGHGDTRHFEAVVNQDNPFAYFNPDNLVFMHYVFNLLLYGFSFVVFFKLVELVYSRRIAIFALIAYCCVFYWIAYVPFSISFITYILNIFFLNLSLYFLISAIKGRCSFLWGVFFYVCVSLTKEAPLIIVPFTVTFYLLTEWKDLTPGKRKEGITTFALMWCFGFIGFILSPLEMGTSVGIGNKITGILQRWNFYAGHLMSNFGILIWISTFYLLLKYFISHNVDRPTKVFYISLFASIAVSSLLWPFQNVALIALFAAFVPIIIMRFKESFAVAWFSVSLCGFMIIGYMTRTYLTDASFGIAIIVGVALSDISSNLRLELNRLPLKVVKGLSVVLFLIICMGIIGYASKIKDKLDVLNVASATRENFRNVIEFITNNLNDHEIRIIVIDYDEMGLSSDDRDWLSYNDLERAHLQKTMKGDFLDLWMKNIVGKKNISIDNLQKFYNNHRSEGSFLFAMSKYEREFVQNLDLKKDIIFKAERGVESAALYYIYKKDGNE